MAMLHADLPPCTLQQVGDIVDLLNHVDIAEAMSIVTVDGFYDLPENIVSIFEQVRNTEPIAKGGFKLGIWPLDGVCKGGENYVLKFETTDDAKNDIGCAAYWENLQLLEKDSSGKKVRVSRIMFYCTPFYIEFFLNALTDVITRQRLTPNLLRTPVQYYILELQTESYEGRSRGAITIQEKVSGDLLHLLKHQKSMTGSGALTYEYVLHYIIQITHCLDLLQRILRFRHNDFWIRNCFIDYRKDASGTLEYITKYGHTFYLQNQGMYMKISDFGWSRFETHSLVGNNIDWLPHSEETLKRGFGWGNRLVGRKYVDYLTQLAGWLVIIFHRYPGMSQSTFFKKKKVKTRSEDSLFSDWLEHWTIDLFTASDEEITEWLKCVLFLFLLFFFVITGPDFAPTFSQSGRDLSRVATKILDQVKKWRRRERDNLSLYQKIAEHIANFPVARQNSSIFSAADVYSFYYKSNSDGFAKFLQGQIIIEAPFGSQRPLQARIPRPLEYRFSMRNVFTFLSDTIEGLDSPSLLSTQNPGGKVASYDTRKIDKFYRYNSNKARFFELRETGPKNIQPPNIVMQKVGDIPATRPRKSRNIGHGIEVYQFETQFSPLGLVDPQNKNFRINGWGRTETEIAIPVSEPYDKIKNSWQFINVVRIPRQSFSKISPSLYHYKSGPKKTLYNLFSDIRYKDVGVVMSGDYFYYKNYKQLPDGRYRVMSGCSPPNCGKTIGWVRENYDQEAFVDYPPVQFYDNYYGFICIQYDREKGHLEKASISPVKNIERYITNDPCGIILSGAPVLLQNGESYFFQKQILQGKSVKNQMSLLERFMIPRSDANQDPENRGINDMTGIGPTEDAPVIGGQLLHLLAPNPRAAFGVTENGDILMVSVEGRKARGAGVDIIQLEKIMMSLGAVEAINLDGGMTADIIYKPQFSNPSVIVETNPMHKFKGSLKQLGVMPGLRPSTALIFTG